MCPVVLIVGHSFDPHVDSLVGHLGDLGCQPIVFDRHCYRHLIHLAVRESGPEGYLQIEDRRIEFQEIKSVWWRLKPIVRSEVTGVFDSVSEEFASREWRATIRCLPSFLPHARWVNPVSAQNEINLKARQLVLAHSVGFRLPDTAFTNDPEAVVSMFSVHDRMIYKTASWFIVPPDEFIYTTEISRDQVVHSPEAIMKAPGIFQELVPKSHELRITVMGDEVFGVKVKSQDLREARIDWREAQFEDIFEETSIDESTRQKILKFHSEAGLVTGVYDLIVPEGGDPIFLECNPAGQWLWLEERLGIPMSISLARILANSE